MIPQEIFQTFGPTERRDNGERIRDWTRSSGISKYRPRSHLGRILITLKIDISNNFQDLPKIPVRPELKVMSTKGPAKRPRNFPQVVKHSAPERRKAI